MIELDDIIVKDKPMFGYVKKKYRPWRYLFSFFVVFSSSSIITMFSIIGHNIVSLGFGFLLLLYWFYFMPRFHNIENEVGRR